eukprot:5538-Heterococcus_DN1.PRE.2
MLAQDCTAQLQVKARGPHQGRRQQSCMMCSTFGAAQKQSSHRLPPCCKLCVFDVRAVIQLMRNFDVDFLSTSGDRSRRMRVSGERKGLNRYTGRM